jgi:hypothetical protein
LVIRANEVSAFDLDDIDDEGVLIVVEDKEHDNGPVKPGPGRVVGAKSTKPRN